VVSIASGLEHSIFLTVDGEAYSCGSDEYGQLGIGKPDRDSLRTPTLIEDEFGEGFAKVECGFYFSAFVTAGANPKLLTCGRNHCM
jgi:alpha-tubulin suppressor-like RCC1 family protein